MPSGQTHDNITLWSLPVIAGITFERTQNSSLTLLLSGGFLFSGLMFGPDLDVHSRQYRRWGALRWIWLPYRRAMRHRSVWSHGPIVGTIVRVLYLLGWLGLFSLVVVLAGAIGLQFADQEKDWWVLVQQWSGSSGEWLGRSLQQHPGEWIALVIGMELGALSHSLSDWMVSAYKRANRQRSQRNNPPKPAPLPPSWQAPTESPEPAKNLPYSELSSPSSQNPPSPPRRAPELPPFGRRRPLS